MTRSGRRGGATATRCCNPLQPVGSHCNPHRGHRAHLVHMPCTCQQARTRRAHADACAVPASHQAVETVTKGIINKLLHSPMAYLRSDSKGDKATVAQIEEIFGLLD